MGFGQSFGQLLIPYRAVPIVSEEQLAESPQLIEREVFEEELVDVNFILSIILDGLFLLGYSFNHFLVVETVESIPGGE